MYNDLMESKKLKDRLLIDLVSSSTDLTNEDTQLLLEVSHALPAISNLENGDTYINVLTQSGKSMVIAQYRYPYSDLYKRNIVGETVEKADEPAVYRALEYGISGRGLIGIIDEGRVVVRHTVSPIYNDQRRVIGALTYEYPNDRCSDTEPICLRNQSEGTNVFLHGEIDKVAGYMQDSLLIFDKNNMCIFANEKAEKLYYGIGYQSIIGQKYKDLQLLEYDQKAVVQGCSTVRDDVKIGDCFFEESISVIWENGAYEGTAVILQDKTQIHQMKDEIAYRIASINEIHHRVKNNLQTIISLVGLEAAQTKNEGVKAFSKTIISRICSISVTYDLLAHTGTDCVNLKTMLIRVVDGSLESCNACGCKVRANVGGDDIELTASVASTVALIVNELVQNSLKYAFDQSSEGTIWMRIEKGEEYSWITVRDDGCGFNHKVEKKAGSGLGLKLVDSLVKSSLKGEISVSSNDQGTATRFSFRNAMKK